MHTLLLRLTRTGGFRSRTVLVLDEAGIAPTRLSARLFAEAERAGVKVVAVGDPGQLGSVQAGGWLAAITAHQAEPTLREAIRQQNLAEREALGALHDGDPDTYLQHKQQEIAVHERELPAIQRLVKQWAAARVRYGTGAAVMIARDNYTRELANRAARSQLKDAGELADSRVLVGGREYTRGDRVIARRNDRHHDVDNGTLATVVELDQHTGKMIVQTDSGQPRALDPVYVAEHLEHAYALTAHGAQGATFQWAGVIGRPEEFTREWSYTALSRARGQTTIHLIAEPPDRDRQREQYAPPAPKRDPAELRDALRLAMRRTETEPLASTQAVRSPAACDHGSRSATGSPSSAARESSPTAPHGGGGEELPQTAKSRGSAVPARDQCAAPGTPPSAAGPPVDEALAETVPIPTPPPQPLKGLDALRRHNQPRRALTLG